MKIDLSKALDNKINMAQKNTTIRFDKSNSELSYTNDIKQVIEKMKEDISKHMEKLTHKNIIFNDLKSKMYDDSIKMSQNKVNQNFSEIIHLIKNLSNNTHNLSKSLEAKHFTAENIKTVDDKHLKIFNNFNPQNQKDSDSKLNENILKQN